MGQWTPLWARSGMSPSSCWFRVCYHVGDPDIYCRNPPNGSATLPLLDGHRHACARLGKDPTHPLLTRLTLGHPRMTLRPTWACVAPPEIHNGFYGTQDPTLACLTPRHPHWASRALRRLTLGFRAWWWLRGRIRGAYKRPRASFGEIYLIITSLTPNTSRGHSLSATLRVSLGGGAPKRVVELRNLDNTIAHSGGISRWGLCHLVGYLDLRRVPSVETH